MRSDSYVLDVVRAIFEWAIDPDRGNCIDSDFRNPFLRRKLHPRKPQVDMLGEPDITVQMAAEFMEACDPYQLTLFVPMIFYGLRASEPIWLFHEDIHASSWLTVSCIEALGYTTKGIRNKRLPLIEPIKTIWCNEDRVQNPHGLIYTRRSAAKAGQAPPLLGVTRDDLIAEYQRRCKDNRNAAHRLAIRNNVLHDAGGLTYEHIQREFKQVRRRLHWQTCATLKDFRHLFSTAMANGAMPEHERRYLMGHDPGKEAIVAYTHLNKIAEHYQRAVESELAPVLRVLRRRLSPVS